MMVAKSQATFTAPTAVTDSHSGIQAFNQQWQQVV